VKNIGSIQKNKLLASLAAFAEVFVVKYDYLKLLSHPRT
jgi:hypothetical protein